MKLINFFQAIFINKITFVGYFLLISGMILIENHFLGQGNDVVNFMIIVGAMFLGSTSFGLHSFKAFRNCQKDPRFIKVYQKGPYCERCISKSPA